MSKSLFSCIFMVLISIASAKNLFLFAASPNLVTYTASQKPTNHEKNGEIIFVYGTSNAGKSSICNALKKVKPDWSFENADDIFEDNLRHVLQKEHPEYLEVIKKAIKEENIFTSSTFLRGVYSFKEGSTPAERQEAISVIKKLQQEHPLLKISVAWENAERELFKRGFAQAAQGKTVVLDSVCPELLFKYQQENNLSSPIRLVCVVCPFLKLAERLEKRNLDAESSGDLTQARYGLFPLANWVKLYKPQESADETVVDCVDKQSVEQAVQSLKEFISERKDPNLSLKREDDTSVEDIGNFTKTMGFTQTKAKISYVPRYRFDQLLITDKQTPQSAANQIANWKRQ